MTVPLPLPLLLLILREYKRQECRSQWYMSFSYGIGSDGNIMRREETDINMKIFGGTPPYLDCNYPVDVS